MHVLLLHVSDCNKEKLIPASIIVNPCKKLDIRTLNLIVLQLQEMDMHLCFTQQSLWNGIFIKIIMCGLPTVVTVLFCHNLLLFLSLSSSTCHYHCHYQYQYHLISLHSLLLIHFISVHVVITILYIYMSSCIFICCRCCCSCCACINIFLYLFICLLFALTKCLFHFEES